MTYIRPRALLIIVLLLGTLVPWIIVAQDERGLGSLRQEGPVGTTRAVIAGVSSYANLPPEKQLHYADDDALLFYAYLRNRFPGQPSSDFTLLMNEEADAHAFCQAIRDMLEISADGDELIIYFAGHGDVFSDSARKIDDAFLLCYNVYRDADYTLSDAVSLKELQELTTIGLKKNMRIILITDACHSGKFVSSEHASANTARILAEKWSSVVRMAACQENQSSYEDVKWGGGHGVFTFYLIEGLKGLADEELIPDSTVMLAELDMYMVRVVAKATVVKQTPVILGDKVAELSKVTTYDAAEEIDVPTLLAQRSAENETLTEDTAVNRLIGTFRVHLARNELLLPEGNCALSVLQELKNHKLPGKLERKLDGSMAVALQQDAQKLLDIYLSGTDNMPPSDSFAFASRELGVAIELLGRTNPLSERCYPKMLFLHAWSILRAADRQNYPIAEKEFRKANRMEKKTAYTLNGLGRFYLWNDRFDKAEKCLRLAVEKAPRWNYPRSNLALVYSNTFRWEQAIREFDALTRMSPTFSWGFNNLGCVYLDMKCYPQALQCFQQAHSLKPQDPVPMLNLGTVALEQGRLEDAKNLYLQSLQADTSFADIYRKLGRYYADNTDLRSTAEQYFLKAVRKEPFFTELNQAAGEFYRDHYDRTSPNFLKAKGYLEQAIALDPHNTDGYYALGRYYLAQTDSSAAVKICRKGVHMNRKSPRAYYLAGCIYHDIRDDGNAEKYYLKSLKKDSLYLYSSINLARLYEQTARPAEAEQLLLHTVDRFPGAPSVPYALANFYFRQARTDDAIAWYETTKRTDSLYSYAWSSLAYLFLDEKNDFPKAAANFERAAMLNPVKHKPGALAELFRTKGDSICRADGNTAMCYDAYKYAWRLDSSNYLSLYSLAKAYYLHLVTDSAVMLTDKLLRKPGLSSMMKEMAATLHARLMLDTGNPALALQEFEKLIAKSPVPSYLGKAIALFSMGRKEQALEFYRLEQEENGDLLGEEYLQKNYSPKALSVIREIRDIDGQ